MAKTITVGKHKAVSKIKRPGVHSKKRNSSCKRSKNYKKQYRSQGR